MIYSGLVFNSGKYKWIDRLNLIAIEYVIIKLTMS